MQNTPFPQSTTTTSGMDTNQSSGTGRADQAVDRASSAAHETVDRLANKATGFAHTMDEQVHRLTEAPMKAWDYSKTTVQDRPMEAVLGALVLGYVLGRLTGSRSYTRRSTDY